MSLFFRQTFYFFIGLIKNEFVFEVCTQNSKQYQLYPKFCVYIFIIKNCICIWIYPKLWLNLASIYFIAGSPAPPPVQISVYCRTKKHSKEAEYKNYGEYRIEKHCTSSYALPGTQYCTAAATAAAVALLH